MRAGRWMWAVTLAAGFMGAALYAQSPIAVKPGTKVKIQLKTKLDTKKSTVGEAVKAQIKQNIKDGHTVLLPSGGYLLGHVTMVTASNHGSPGKIGVLFNEVTDKHGKELGTIRVAIVHIAAASVNYNAMSMSPEMGGGTPPAMAGTGPALTSADQSSNGKPLEFAVMETYNGNGADLGSVMTSPHDNFNLDDGQTVQAQVLAPGSN